MKTKVKRKQAVMLGLIAVFAVLLCNALTSAFYKLPEARFEHRARKLARRKRREADEAKSAPADALEEQGGGADA